MRFEYLVTVMCETPEQAEQVMGERLGYDEDYGFEYQLDFRKPTGATILIDHPDHHDMWRHEPPLWEPCYVCGHPTCWVELDIGFKHPECDMYPSEEGDVRIELGVKSVEAKTSS